MEDDKDFEKENLPKKRKVNIPPRKIREERKLYRKIRLSETKGKCAFEKNRGYHPEDDRCHECSVFDECRAASTKRLLSILDGLFQLEDDETKRDCRLENADDWHDAGVLNPSKYKDEFIYETKLNDSWFREHHDEIREYARRIIDHHINPERIHKNTIRYFQNCFPEWNKFEKNYAKAKNQENAEDELRDYYYDEYSEKAYVNFDYDDLFKESELIDFRNKFLQDFIKYKRSNLAQALKELEQEKIEYIQSCNTFIDTITEQYNISDKEEPYPKKWMKRYNKFFNSASGKTFLQHYNYYWKRQIKYQASLQIPFNPDCKKNIEKIQKRLRKQKMTDLKDEINKLEGISFPNDDQIKVLDTKKKQLAENKLPSIVYVQIKQKQVWKDLNASEGTVLKYLKDFKQLGILKEIGKPKRDEGTYYAIGRWGSFPDKNNIRKPMPISFFIRTDEILTELKKRSKRSK